MYAKFTVIKTFILIILYLLQMLPFIDFFPDLYSTRPVKV